MSEHRVERLRKLLAMEIRRVTEDLDRRHKLLVEIWGRQRVRAPFIDTTFSRWTSLGFQDLSQLTSDEIDALDHFYRELDEIRLYLTFTEDMPRNLDVALSGGIARLRRRADASLAALGCDPIGEVIPLDWPGEGAPPAGQEVEFPLSLDWEEE